MTKLESYLIDASKNAGISMDNEQISRFDLYYNMLIEWNSKINLTAITEPYDVAVKHFIDSLMILKYVNIPNNAAVIDVGTGAGFPGVPLKIMRPDIKLVLLDSLNKRLIFLQELLDSLGISAELVHSRAEEGSRTSAHREKYDLAVSRAVASMNVLCEYCMPYVKVGGRFVAMKGFDCDNELKTAKQAVAALGGKVSNVNKFTLPDDSGRAIVTIDKIKSTPVKYPRHGSKIAKSPIV